MANDIIDIDVFQTVENVEITVEPNLTTVNITDSVAVTDVTKLAILNNLSDLNNVSTARTNLGLGTLATQSGTFNDKANLASPTFTGSVQVPNASASTEAVNKGQLDAVSLNSVLVPLNEGGGVGYVINGRNPANFGNVGLNATDLSFSDAVSSVRGATGTRSFAEGYNTRASGENSVALNVGTTASALHSLATGNNTTASSQEATAMGGFTTASGFRSMAVNSSTTASGHTSFSANESTEARSFVEATFGRLNTLVTPSSTTAWVSTDRLFGVGNGTSAGARSDALIILKNGLATLPSVTNALITAGGAKSVITKEYADANYSGGGGATNLSTTQTASDFTIESNTGTDAIVPLGNGTLAGASLNDFTNTEKTKVANTSGTNTGDNATNSQYSGLATSKQDALGFTPYNATNPSGYQTSGQVQTIADAKVSNEALNSGWYGITNIAPSQGAMYDYLETLVNDVTNKQPLSSVLTATTASFTTGDETKLDGIATGATANSSDATLLARANHTGTQLSSTISDFNSASRAQTEAELVAGENITITPSGTGATRQLTIASTGGSSAQSAFTVLANNTSSTATPTNQVFKSVAEQTYSGTITWGTAAPTTILANTYRWQQVGKFVTAQFNFSYNNPATNLQVIFTLPTDMPTPQTVSGFTGPLDIICYGVGNMFISTTATPTTSRVCSLRRNSANTGYEFLMLQLSSSSIKTLQLSITYEAL